MLKLVAIKGCSGYSGVESMKEIRIITHNGKFHADDVFAVATIRLVLGADTHSTIIRTRDQDLIDSGDYVVDVGLVHDAKKKRFDHHQEGGAGQRDNGIPFASFGLIWNEYGNTLCGNPRVTKMIEERLVMPIDAIDNGVNLTKNIFTGIRPYGISDFFYSFLTDREQVEKEYDDIFVALVRIAEGIIHREILKAKKILSDEQKVSKVYEESDDKRVIIFDSNIAWENILVGKPEPLVVVYPSIDGKDWRAKTVPVEDDSFERRALFPIEWAGKVDEDLQNISGVPDAKFCHRGRFLAVANSKQGAIKLAEKIIT